MKINSIDVPNVVLVFTRIFTTVFLVFIAFIAYRFLFRQYLDDGRIATTLLGLWLLTAYFVLPRLHSWLSKIYVPDYFIGRVRTGDGLLGDPVNLAFIGSKRQVMRAMQAAGWQHADDLSFKSSVKMVQATLFRKSYIHAPVSSLYLFGRVQDMTYQREVDGNPARRHHVRFWKTPPGWKLPGGFKADWLAAATFDKSVGVSLFTLQITHKIAEDTDHERDFIIKTLQKSGQVKHLNIVKDYSTGYHHRNGGGDAMKTDGAMPFIIVK